MPLADFRINPYVQPYVGGLNKELGEAVDQRVKTYEAAAEFDDVLGYQTDTLLQNTAPFEGDVAYGKELMNNYRQVLGERAQKGDYENMLRDVKRSARQFSQEITPLIERKKAYSAYKNTVQDLYQKGDIDLEMYNAAMKKTVDDNSNVDREAILRGSFSGFVPTKKSNISTMLDDAIKGMEAQGLVGKMQVNSDGTYTIVGGEYRTSQDILKAAENYLLGSSDYKNYAGTLSTLGLQDKLINETSAGMQYVAQKYKFQKPDVKQGFVPDGYMKGITEKLYLNSPSSSPSTVSQNAFLEDRFQGSKMYNGQLRRDTDYYTVDREGNYLAYYDNKGKQITIADKEGLDKARGAGGRGPELQYNVQALPPEQAQRLDIETNKEFTELVKDTYIADRGVNYNGTARNAFLLANNNSWNSPEYRKQVLDRYNTAKDNFVKVETAKWNKQKLTDVKLIGDQYTPDFGVLASSLAGRNIAVMGEDGTTDVPQGFREGVKDINSLYATLQDKGWEVESLTDNGLLKWNPLDKNPASSVTLNIKDKSNNKRQIELAVGIGQRDQAPLLQTLQQAGMAYLTSRGGIINSPDGNKYLVKVIPTQIEAGNKKADFRGTVVALDKDNNPLGQEIPFDQFVDNFIKHPLVQQEARRFLTN